MRVLLAIITILFSIISFSAKEPYSHKGYDTRELALIGQNNAKEIKWTSVEEIRKSLEGIAPMTVSFDIDDTTLISSECFYYGNNTFSTEDKSYLKKQEFWNFMQNGCDQYSIPKESAKEIIKMHQERGDKIIFITGRTAGVQNDNTTLDILGTLIKKAFNIENMQPISYRTPETKAANKYDKTYYIKKYNVKLHYGDSDDDILAAREAGIRGIRVLRSATSTNLPLPKNGGYGEEVVKGSEY